MTDFSATVLLGTVVVLSFLIGALVGAPILIILKLI